MKVFLPLLLLCGAASAAQYDGGFNYVVSMGVPNIPNLTVTADFHGFPLFYSNSSTAGGRVKHQWFRDWFTGNSLGAFHSVDDITAFGTNANSTLQDLVRQLNVTNDVVQLRLGCRMDVKASRTDCYLACGYDETDFMVFDANTTTWNASQPEGQDIATSWNEDGNSTQSLAQMLTVTLPDDMWRILHETPLNRTVLPSMSLLQRSPSSPVSCHATGFFPETADLFWRRDGQRIREGVSGKVLPNSDESFQMSVDLNVSSIPLANWTKYECVFELQSVGNETIPKTISLEKERILSNYRSENVAGPASRPTGFLRDKLSKEAIATFVVMSVVIVAVIIAMVVAGFKHRNAGNTTTVYPTHVDLVLAHHPPDKWMETEQTFET